MVDFNYLWAEILASIVAFSLVSHHRDKTIWLAILYLGALGLSLFGVRSIDKALAHGFSMSVAIIMATITGIGGSLLRDVLAMRESLLRNREVYAETLIAGGAVYAFLLSLFSSSSFAGLCGGVFIFAFRDLRLIFIESAKIFNFSRVI